MDKILQRIIAARNKKGYSYENMASEIQLSVSAYRKIETGETKLTVERLYQIAEILDVSLQEILDIKTENYQQTINDGSTGFQQKENHYYVDNKEVYEMLIQSKDEQIALLKSMLDKFK